MVLTMGATFNTIVIFTTDNGTTFGANHGATTLEPPIYIPDAWGNRQPFNAGMRGQKGSAYDGGHRVPCFIYWPSGGLQGGVDVGRLTAHIDLLPTLMDLAGLQRSDGPPLDGVSLVPLLKGQGGIRERSLVVQKDNREVRRPRPWEGSAVMTERWRLINGRELYDMDGDPGQGNDVSGQNAEVVSRLRTRYE